MPLKEDYKSILEKYKKYYTNIDTYQHPVKWLEYILIIQSLCNIKCVLSKLKIEYLDKDRYYRMRIKRKSAFFKNVLAQLLLYQHSFELEDILENTNITQCFIYFVKIDSRMNGDINAVIYETEDKIETNMAAQLLINPNNIEYLSSVDTNKLISNKKSFNMLFKELQWMYTHIDVIDLERILLIHGVSNVMLGLRQINDIDMLVSSKGKVLKPIIDKFFIKNNEIFQKKDIDTDIDMFYEGVSFQREQTMDWNDYFDQYSKTSSGQYFFDTNKYINFFGFKVLSLELNIQSRKDRNRPKAIAELIAINDIMPDKVSFPKIPKYKLDYNKSYITDTEIKMFYKLGLIDKEKKKQKKKFNKKEFINIIQFHLNKLYNIDQNYEAIEQLIK
jgi:hypothetical protein